jgi:hypothetical protein
VHRREVLSERPWVVFPGNLQGRHFRETGPKGATLVEVSDGRVTSVEPRSLDVVRWSVCEVDATDAGGTDDVIDGCRAALGGAVAAAEGRTLAARVVVRGASSAHADLVAHAERWEAELRAMGSEFADDLFIERVDVATRAPLDVAALAGRQDAIGQVARALAALKRDPDGRAALLAELSELRTKLPAEAREGVDSVKLDDPESLAVVLDDVEQMLLPALAALGSDE